MNYAIRHSLFRRGRRDYRPWALLVWPFLLCPVGWGQAKLKCENGQAPSQMEVELSAGAIEDALERVVANHLPEALDNLKKVKFGRIEVSPPPECTELSQKQKDSQRRQSYQQQRAQIEAQADHQKDRIFEERQKALSRLANPGESNRDREVNRIDEEYKGRREEIETQRDQQLVTLAGKFPEFDFVNSWKNCPGFPHHLVDGRANNPLPLAQLESELLPEPAGVGLENLQIETAVHGRPKVHCSKSGPLECEIIVPVEDFRLRTQADIFSAGPMGGKFFAAKDHLQLNVKPQNKGPKPHLRLRVNLQDYLAGKALGGRLDFDVPQDAVTLNSTLDSRALARQFSEHLLRAYKNSPIFSEAEQRYLNSGKREVKRNALLARKLLDQEPASRDGKSFADNFAKATSRAYGEHYHCERLDAEVCVLAAEVYESVMNHTAIVKNMVHESKGLIAEKLSPLLLQSIKDEVEGAIQFHGGQVFHVDYPIPRVQDWYYEKEIASEFSGRLKELQKFGDNLGKAKRIEDLEKLFADPHEGDLRVRDQADNNTRRAYSPNQWQALLSKLMQSGNPSELRYLRDLQSELERINSLMADKMNQSNGLSGFFLDLKLKQEWGAMGDLKGQVQQALKHRAGFEKRGQTGTLPLQITKLRRGENNSLLATVQGCVEQGALPVVMGGDRVRPCLSQFATGTKIRMQDINSYLAVIQKQKGFDICRDPTGPKSCGTRIEFSEPPRLVTRQVSCAELSQNLCAPGENKVSIPYLEIPAIKIESDDFLEKAMCKEGRFNIVVRLKPVIFPGREFFDADDIEITPDLQPTMCHALMVPIAVVNPMVGLAVLSSTEVIKRVVFSQLPHSLASQLNSGEGASVLGYSLSEVQFNQGYLSIYTTKSDAKDNHQLSSQASSLCRLAWEAQSQSRSNRASDEQNGVR